MFGKSNASWRDQRRAAAAQQILVHLRAGPFEGGGDGYCTAGSFLIGLWLWWISLT